MALSSFLLRRSLSTFSTLRRSLAAIPAISAPSSSSSPLIHDTACVQYPTQSRALLFQSRMFRSSSISLLSSQPSHDNKNDGTGPDRILFEGCDYNHWLFVMDFPKDPKPSPEEMVRTYEETCAKGLNISVEEAKSKIYACSTTTYTGFQAVMTEEESEMFNGLPGVIFVLPDSYVDPQNKEYGGDKYINGTIIPRPPPVQYGRPTGRYNDRNRFSDQPRYDRQGQQGKPSYGNQQENPSYGNQQGNPSYGYQSPTQGGGRDYGNPQNYSPQQNYGPPGQGQGRNLLPMNAPKGRDPMPMNAPQERDPMPMSAPQGRYPMPMNASRVRDPMLMNAPQGRDPMPMNTPQERDPMPMNAPQGRYPMPMNAPQGRDPMLMNAPQGRDPMPMNAPQGRYPMPMNAPQGRDPMPMNAPQGRYPMPMNAPQGRDPMPMNAPQGTDPYQSARGGSTPSYQENYNPTEAENFHPQQERNFPLADQGRYAPPWQGRGDNRNYGATQGENYGQVGGGYQGLGPPEVYRQGTPSGFVQNYPSSGQGEGQTFSEGKLRNVEGEQWNFPPMEQTGYDQGRY